MDNALPLAVEEPELAEYLRDPRRAITSDGIVCLVCGRRFRHLTNTHLRSHGLTSDGYKVQFGYNMHRALMVASLRSLHSVNAGRMGLADRIRRRPLFENIELRRQGGRHRHALEELLTRRESPPRFHAEQPRDGRGRFTVVPAVPSNGETHADARTEPVYREGGGHP